MSLNFFNSFLCLFCSDFFGGETLFRSRKFVLRKHEVYVTVYFRLGKKVELEKVELENVEKKKLSTLRAREDQT